MSTAHSGERELDEILASSLVDVCQESNEDVPPSSTLWGAALPVASTYHSTLIQQLRAVPDRAVAMTDFTFDGSSAVSWSHLAISTAFESECVELVAIPLEESRVLCPLHVERHSSGEVQMVQEPAGRFVRELLRFWAALEGKAHG
jgi:hypothetical protein